MRVNQVIAHAAVWKAINGGSLQKLDGTIDCVDCGKPARDYEHRDYLKPLDVEPVCRSCNCYRGEALNAGDIVIQADVDKSDWHEKTQTMLANTEISIPVIAKATGLQDRWLRLLKADKLRDPGINKCWKVYNYLLRRK